MKDKTIFFDTNVLLYLLSAETEKANRVEELLRNGGIISVQVLNEFANVAFKKLKMSWGEIREILSTFRCLCDVNPISLETHELSIEIAERYGFSLYDSMIVSAALLADCRVLYSEDLQNAQQLKQLTIKNPFL